MTDRPTTPEPTTPAEDPAVAPGIAPRGRGRRIAITVAIVLAGLALGAIGTLLAFGGFGVVVGGDDVRALQQRPAKGEYEYFDALVIEANDDSMVLQERTGRRQTIVIREADRPLIDVQHAQSHAALGQPVRVYWDEIDGERSIVYLEDSPEIFR